MKRFKWAGLLVVFLTVPASATVSDSNLHNLTGTLTACQCETFNGDVICRASIEEGAPYPHFTSTFTTTIAVEFVEQAIGQCDMMQVTIPRKVKAYYWLEAAGVDYAHGILRSPVRIYYWSDLGAP